MQGIYICESSLYEEWVMKSYQFKLNGNDPFFFLLEFYWIFWWKSQRNFKNEVASVLNFMINKWNRMYVFILRLFHDKYMK